MKKYAKLPIEFEVSLLQQELVICAAAWTDHFNTGYYTGNWSGIPLRSPQGKNHSISAGNSSSVDFADEAILAHLTYTRSVIDAIQAPKSAVRYLRLTPGSEIKPHKDFDLVFWDGFVRLHIPVLTNDQVKFSVENEILNMKEGECWFADFSKTHSVINHGETDRVHLVIDCQVNDWLRELFVNAGVIQPDESAPTEMETYDNATKLMIIEQLEAQGTKKSLAIAMNMREKMNTESLSPK
ncbi:Aspartyl/Asparaginyl beta-hydroxylase [Fulvivirga imtechensis AK7]|uniref:Aspartyl/Asparaginyl beta-hydroxylase n=1 Tax=Fulvivirga imtechensis AK7 TaxID=1237149 RepID=L8JSA6_9BACT|nr:aspartyl/asparaginyl beta-hydroxylase domain-containing protein [Fulvivirga imtechensis]ELR71098.1 Aspartyl/Asparaginyl beta-hydroxylase [Fulvivirga imtechensis AK7]